MVAAICNALLNIWLVPYWGIDAAAINTAVGYAILLGLVAAYALKMHGPIVTPEWRPTIMGVILVGAGYAIGILSAPSGAASRLAISLAVWIAVATAIAVKVMGIRLSRKGLRMILPTR